MQEKICEVYREKLQSYQDAPLVKNLNNYNNVNYYEELWKKPVDRPMD